MTFFSSNLLPAYLCVYGGITVRSGWWICFCAQCPDIETKCWEEMRLTFVVRYDIIPCCRRVELSAIALRVPYIQKLTSGSDGLRRGILSIFVRRSKSCRCDATTSLTQRYWQQQRRQPQDSSYRTLFHCLFLFKSTTRTMLLVSLTPFYTRIISEASPVVSYRRRRTITHGPLSTMFCTREGLEFFQAYGGFITRKMDSGSP